MKEQIELISGNKVIKYEKGFKKIKFESNDDLTLGKISNIPVCIITEEVFLKKMVNIIHNCCYINVCMNMKNKLL